MKPFIPYSNHLKPYSRNLRTQMTDAEILLWSKLRRKQILGIQFFRQKPIGDYIVDFYGPKVKLVVEADGGQHFDDEGFRRDQERIKELVAMGLKVLRYSNHEILKELDAVMSDIYYKVEIFLAGN